MIQTEAEKDQIFKSPQKLEKVEFNRISSKSKNLYKPAI